jgi:hypothetical protein
MVWPSRSERLSLPPEGDDTGPGERSRDDATAIPNLNTWESIGLPPRHSKGAVTEPIEKSTDFATKRNSENEEEGQHDFVHR